MAMLKWAKSEENLALRDVFSKVFEVSSMWTNLMKDFTEEASKINFVRNFFLFIFANNNNLLLAKDKLIHSTHYSIRSYTFVCALCTIMCIFE